MATRKYNVDSLENFEGLEALRKRPGMYIGPTDSNGIWILCKEAADNTTDEFLSGRNKSCHIIQAPDESVWILDEGTGIPVGNTTLKSGEKINSLTMVVSKLHAGGKFGKGAYSASIGVHGVGIKATNALSEMFEVYTNYDGNWWHTAYSKGKETVPVKKSGAPKVSHGIEVRKGTAIHFKPDMSIFAKGSKFVPAMAAEWCKLTAYLNAGYKTTFTDSVGKTKTWCFKNGVKDYLSARLEALQTKPLGKNVFYHADPTIDIAIAFTNYDGISVEAYTNSSKNTDGGNHVTAFYSALGKAIEPYKLRSHKFTPSDLREGLIGIINYKIAEPQFSSQTKEKLTDTRVTKPCEETCFKALKTFFDENKTLAKEICRRAAELKALKDQFSENKKALQDLAKAAKGGKFHPKHVRVDCPEDVRELYLVEGDSAGGCFVATTQILLHDGTTKSIHQLVNDAQDGKTNVGVSYSVEDKKFETFEIKHPRITKVVEELIELTLDSGHIITCTPSHRFLLESGEYKEAKDLTETDVIRELPQHVSLPDTLGS